MLFPLSVNDFLGLVGVSASLRLILKSIASLHYSTCIRLVSPEFPKNIATTHTSISTPQPLATSYQAPVTKHPNQTPSIRLI